MAKRDKLFDKVISGKAGWKTACERQESCGIAYHIPDMGLVGRGRQTCASTFGFMFVSTWDERELVFYPRLSACGYKTQPSVDRVVASKCPSSVCGAHSPWMAGSLSCTFL